MSRILAAASALLVVTASWSVSAQQSAPGAQGVAAPRATKLTQAPRPGVLSIIQGNAVRANGEPMVNTVVRLRDARFGRVVDTQITGKSGEFGFKVTDPGSYVVELMAKDQTLLAASQILNVNAGEAVSAIVKLPMYIPPFAGVLASTTAPTAALIASQAAATGIAAAVSTTPISPVQ